MVQRAENAQFSAAWVNLRLSPIRKLAAEMADNGYLDPVITAAVGRVRGMERRGVRLGNWLLQDQAFELLNAPDASTLADKRDRAVLALLLGCGLRRAELLGVNVEEIQQREGRWVIPDMKGKGNRLRTVPIPALVKDGIDRWTAAAGIETGRFECVVMGTWETSLVTGKTRLLAITITNPSGECRSGWYTVHFKGGSTEMECVGCLWILVRHLK